MDKVKEWTSRKIFSPIMEWKRGSNYRKYLRDVSAIQMAPFDTIKRHQQSRIASIVAVARSFPLYSSRLAQVRMDASGMIPDDVWKNIEPLSRDDIRTIGARLESQGAVSAGVLKSATGGTTSAPVTFYIEREAADRRWAVTRFFDGLLGYEPGRKIAYLWGATQDFPEYAGWRAYLLREWIDRNMFLPASQLSDVNLRAYFGALYRFRPLLLQAYPSALKVLADYLVRNSLNLQIPAISCTAESMTNEQREAIQVAFGADPVNWYGAREAGRIATECEARDGLHINCYGLLVENEKEGPLSRLLITDLWNSVMPIIRYDIGDVAEIDYTRCACGNEAPRIRNLAGRVADMFVCRDGRPVPGVVMTNRIVKESLEVKEIQIIQRDLGSFKIRIVPGEGYKPGETEVKLTGKFNELIGETSEVSVQIEERIERERSGKVRICKNEMPAAELRRYI